MVQSNRRLIMIDLNYIKYYSRHVKIQVDMFESELSHYEGYKFNFVDTLSSTPYEITTEVDVNQPYPPLDSHKLYRLDECNFFIFARLANEIAFQCAKRGKKEANILLADSYLFPVEEDSEVKIKGIVLVNFL